MENKNLPKVFVGSSFQSLVFTHALQEKLKDQAELITWDKYFYDRQQGATLNFYNIIQNALEDFQYAIFLISGDNAFDSMGRELKEKLKLTYSSGTTANVWLEAGMFLARNSASNVVLAKERHFNIEIPSDLSGYKLPEFEAPPAHHKEGDEFNYLKYVDEDGRCAWNELGETRNKAYLSSIERVATIAVKMLKNKPINILPRILRSSLECYAIAERMIKEADIHTNIHTIMAFEGETTLPEMSQSLWPAIKTRIDTMKKAFVNGSGHDSYEDLDENLQEKCQRYCTQSNFRWINLHGDELSKQAKEILDDYAGFITIKDTHCKYVELVLVGSEALILFPDIVNGTLKVTSYGIYLNDINFCNNLRTWFFNFAPEQLGLNIDNSMKLSQYRELEWPANQRNSRNSCSACLTQLDGIPVELREKLAEINLVEPPKSSYMK